MRFNRKDLKTLVELHVMEELGFKHQDALESIGMNDGQVKLVHGAIDMRNTVVSELMLPLGEMFCLSTESIVDKRVRWEIFEKGYTRIPVYRGTNSQNIIGILHAKRLIGK
jgi:metal transporter CNNM